jgi:hypothetical protein
VALSPWVYVSPLHFVQNSDEVSLFLWKVQGLDSLSLPSLDVASKGDSNNSSLLVVLLPRVGAVGRLALAMLQELAYRKAIKVRNGCRVVRHSGADTASIRQASSASPHGSVRLAVVCDWDDTLPTPCLHLARENRQVETPDTKPRWTDCGGRSS